MGVAHSSCSHSTLSSDTLYSYSFYTALSPKLLSKSPKTGFGFKPTNQNQIFKTHIPKPIKIMSQPGKVEALKTQEGISSRPSFDFHGIDQKLVDKMVYDALVWSSLHGLVVGDKSNQVCALSSLSFQSLKL